MLKAAYTRGAREAFAKFGLNKQPALPKGEFKLPKSEGLPPLPPPENYKPPGPVDSLGENAAKNAADVGMAMSTARHEGPGAVRGEPADAGRRQESIIERAFQANEDLAATSSMPRPAGGAYP